MEFYYDFARSVIIFSVDNSLSPHIENLKNILCEEVLLVLMEALVHQK